MPLFGDSLQSSEDLLPANVQACSNMMGHFRNNLTSVHASDSSNGCSRADDEFDHRGSRETNPSVKPPDGVIPTPIIKSQVLSASDVEVRSNWLANRYEVAKSPYEYVSGLPSKGVRDKLICALNDWFRCPEHIVSAVTDVISMLHNSSLILDDLQDHSPLRRGKPSTHTVFGPAQAINSATHAIVEAISKIQAFVDYTYVPESIKVILMIFEGQAMELSWTFNDKCPSVQEYLLMVKDKTGALFALACHLLMTHSADRLSKDRVASVEDLVSLLGQYFQIRDDYMNLVDADYTNQKGFCEDLDEGKFSLPLIHALKNDGRGILRNLLSVRRVQGQLNVWQKVLALDRIKALGSLEWTQSLLANMHTRIVSEIVHLERTLGRDNQELRVLVELLRLQS